MVASVIDGTRLCGAVSCLPAEREDAGVLAARFGAEAASRVAKATGITSRHVAPPGVCTSDLATTAAADLLAGLGWPAESIDLLIMVSQTQDHLLPASAFLIHRQLGLGRHCAVFDQGLGCSGFIYGLWTASSLLQTITGGRRALVLAGDTTARLCAADDRAVAPLFGDGAAAVALERYGPEDAPATGEEASGDTRMVFALGADGSGAPYLMVAGGGMRHPEQPPRLFMDGTQVFAFTLREVPANVAATLEAAGWGAGEVDHFVFHQANAQMIRHLGQKIGARPNQMVLALAEFGNTSSASIPLALTTALAEPLTTGRLRLLLSGFGVGWSWGSVALSAGPLAVCRTLTLDGNGGVQPWP